VVKPYKRAFFPIGLTDAAAFHQVLANLAMQLNRYRAPGQTVADYEQREVVTRHTAALHLIQKRMSNPNEATQDGTIATIVAMICYSVGPSFDLTITRI